MSSKFIVYGLIDPRDNVIFYVGKSCNGFKAMRRHTQPWSSKENNSPKNQRIIEIINAGFEIEYVILAEAKNRRDIEIKERLTIFRMQKQVELCNIKMNYCLTKEQ